MDKKRADRPSFDRLVKSLRQAHARGEDLPGPVVHAPREIEADDASGMALSDFRIGGEFLCGPGRWRCTDIGTRVIVAIRVDETEIATVETGKPTVARTISGAEAAMGGWFDGPPYAVLEHVFDEDDWGACSPVEG